MNELIEKIFADSSFPVAFMHYEGHGEPYVIYQETDKADSYAADDGIEGYVSYFDFDFYSKGNYKAIIAEVKTKLEENGFVWQPSRDSRDMYETDTGYYHKTVCFAALRQKGENNG